MQLPLHIPQLDVFTDDELVRFCLANPELRIERDENGILYINMSPTHLLTSSNNSELNTEIGIWNRKKKGGKVIDSNGGFFLNDKSMKAPDVAWIRREQWDALSKKEKHSFPHLAPDFVLELASDSDNIEVLKEKMVKWIDNGVRLAWLVSPDEKLTYIYRHEHPVGTKAFSEVLSGENVLVGFETVLADILEE
ncbi:Uma2 family endonuclease [Spirosoma fluviale]|uniref:Endonuclease, Uma2 family (Restriction endonuclease fold) n=1 Tax=Spirosoma fluviale TaxID=1597977 RepID=A0A286F903_9BACT|nr:Uma2 family endonuclease [Spirosoma fluviale]SOD79672.1 Endonuclease, Uma2 family (restriction endonuclease fold) [Spirosoma fluviale]